MTENQCSSLLQGTNEAHCYREPMKLIVTGNQCSSLLQGTNAAHCYSEPMQLIVTANQCSSLLQRTNTAHCYRVNYAKTCSHHPLKAQLWYRNHRLNSSDFLLYEIHNQRCRHNKEVGQRLHEWSKVKFCWNFCMFCTLF